MAPAKGNKKAAKQVIVEEQLSAEESTIAQPMIENVQEPVTSDVTDVTDVSDVACEAGGAKLLPRQMKQLLLLRRKRLQRSQRYPLSQLHWRKPWRL